MTALSLRNASHERMRRCPPVWEYGGLYANKSVASFGSWLSWAKWPLDPVVLRSQPFGCIAIIVEEDFCNYRFYCPDGLSVGSNCPRGRGPQLSLYDRRLVDVKIPGQWATAPEALLHSSGKLAKLSNFRHLVHMLPAISSFLTRVATIRRNSVFVLYSGRKNTKGNRIAQLPHLSQAAVIVLSGNWLP